MTREAVPRIKALIFDFDGLILDTETPDYQVWQSIYREHGFELPHEEWGKIIGGTGFAQFDAAEHLSLLTQGRLDSLTLRARHHSESHALTLSQTVLPGVMDYLQAAKRLNLKLAIASSSPHSWVDTHAKRLGVFEYFDKVICADDVAVGRTKPNPDLFLLALKRLNVRKEEAIVFEDSPNGVKAAKSAGIFVVAVPNPVTSLLSIENANLTLTSLSDLSLTDLLDKVQ
ncbi:MAG TPA: HAD family hydrolase [Anaerolineales bacterium]|nr:HAD family hydrolase [Anaerolineales bacterium]HLO31926.1 HAD family hydrolase [Anaerolineales bacterium]